MGMLLRSHEPQQYYYKYDLSIQLPGKPREEKIVMTMRRAVMGDQRS